MTELVVTREKPELPARYEAAKQALSECVKVDECAEWADRSKAIAVYAFQSKDEDLYRHAVRIRARAIQRLGELLNQVQAAQGGRGKPRTPGTRVYEASAAGLSERDRKTALRVAAVPKAMFEELVESDRPPTIPMLAALGTNRRPVPARTREEAADFSASTEGQAALGVLYRVVRKLQPTVVARGATRLERVRIASESKTCIHWLTTLLKELRRQK